MTSSIVPSSLYNPTDEEYKELVTETGCSEEKLHVSRLVI